MCIESSSSLPGILKPGVKTPSSWLLLLLLPEHLLSRLHRCWLWLVHSLHRLHPHGQLGVWDSARLTLGWHAHLAQPCLAHPHLAHSCLAHSWLAHSCLAHPWLAHSWLAHSRLAHSWLAHPCLSHPWLAHPHLTHAWLTYHNRKRNRFAVESTLLPV